MIAIKLDGTMSQFCCAAATSAVNVVSHTAAVRVHLAQASQNFGGTAVIISGDRSPMES